MLPWLHEQSHPLLACVWTRLQKKNNAIGIVKQQFLSSTPSFYFLLFFLPSPRFAQLQHLQWKMLFGNTSATTNVTPAAPMRPVYEHHYGHTRPWCTDTAFARTHRHAPRPNLISPPLLGGCRALMWARRSVQHHRLPFSQLTGLFCQQSHVVRVAS